MLEIKYFASLSGSLNVKSEQIDYEIQIQTAADVIKKLVARGGIWAEEFSGDKKILIAINRQMCERDVVVNDGDEVAFFRR